jgi:hypothetical protein
MFVDMQAILDQSYTDIWLTPGVRANLYRSHLLPATSFDGRKYQLHRFKKMA